MGRYFERAHHQAYLLNVIETLETEELNSAERRHYRPMWNRLLPPLEKTAGTSRRSITTPARPISPGGFAGAGFCRDHVSPRVSQRRMRAGLAQPGSVGDDQ
jgi:hypothetical protein